MSESETMADAPRRGGVPWYVWDIVFASPLFVLGTFLHLGPVFRYFEGLRNESGAFGLACSFMLVLVPAVLVSLPVMLTRMIISWPKHIRSKRRLWALRLLLVPGLLAYCALWFTPLPPSPGLTFMRGFEKYVNANVDIPAIQAWLSELDPNDFGEPGEEVIGELEAAAKRLPAIARVEPRWINVYRDEKGRPMMRLWWGSGFLSDSYGLVVGREDMEIPETEPPRWTYYPPGTKANRYREHGEYRSQVAPGAYVWRDLD